MFKSIVILIASLHLPAALVSAEQNHMIKLINAEREKEGAPSLIVHPGLTTVASNWTKTMVATCVLKHNPTIVKQTPKGWKKLGENVGFGNSMENIVEGYMASPVHRENVLDPSMDRIGVGVVRTSQGVWNTLMVWDTGRTPKNVVVSRAPDPVVICTQSG